MACSRGRISPSAVTKLRLFSESGGYCQNPSCRSSLFVDTGSDAIHIAEIAHVISAENGGPRAVEAMTPEARAAYDNLLLLCPTCHTIIDKAEASFPDSLIRSWKEDHRNKIADLFGVRIYETRAAVRAAIEPSLRENRTIFENYGPMTMDRFNPESTLPAQWLRKIRDNILPNNRKILAICDANARHLANEEASVLDLFRQHVNDFEAKHVAGVEESGMQFPERASDLFL